MASYSRSSFIPQSVTLNAQCRNNPLVLQLKSINNSMRKIDAYVVMGLKGKRKLLDEQRKQDQQEERKAKQLANFQKQKGNPINFLKERLPKTGFLDSIKNFILYTFMGMAVPYFLKALPSILNIVKFLTPFVAGFGMFAEKVLGGLIGAIDFGYRVHDKIRGVLKQVTGSNYEKAFDDLEKNLNTFLNVAIIAGMAIAGSGAMPKPQQIGARAGKVGGLKLPPNVTKGSYERLKESYRSFQAGTANAGDRLRLARRGIVSPEKLSSKIPAPAGKFAGKFGKVFGRLPIIGGLIDFTISMLMGEKPGRAAARAVGSGIGLGLGAFIPVIGQIGVGPVIGSIVGDIVGGALYDTLESFGKPRAHAKGGRVGSRTYSRTSRTLKKPKAKPPARQPKQRSMPGKNVGGDDAIKKLFPDTDKDDTMSPYRALKRSSEIMKKGGVFGNLLGAGLDMMAFGQKIEKSTLKGLENYLGYVIQSAIEDQSATNAKVIGSSMFAMAEGGIVPSARSLSSGGKTTGEMVAKELVRSFTAMLDRRTIDIFQNIKRELELKGPEGEKIKPGPGQGGMIEVTSSSPDFWLLATAALFEGISPQGYADVAQAIYNRVAMPGDPWKVNGSIRTAILNPDQFQPVTDYGGAGVWGQIKDKESAIAFIKSKGKTQEQLEAAAAAILDTNRQRSARTFVGPRDSFRSYEYENKNNHIADDTEVRREGHAFGFEPRGSTIAAFRAGRLKPAEINKQIVMGQVSQTGLGTGSATLDEIRRLAESMGVPLYSHVRTGNPKSYHYTGQAMDFSNSTGPTPEMLKLAQTIAARYGSSLAELYYTPLGYGIKDGKRVSVADLDEEVNRTHYNHVHVAVTTGKPRIENQAQKPPTATSSRPAFNPANLKPLETHSPTVSVLSSFPVFENGKKAVYTRKRVNNNDVYTRNGKIISEDEFWRASGKKNSISSNQMGENGTTLSIASSPQYERLRGNVDIARTNYTDTTTNTKIYLIPVTA